jgi:hypothetical protein
MKAQGQNGYEEGVLRLHEIENKEYSPTDADGGGGE